MINFAVSIKYTNFIIMFKGLIQWYRRQRDDIRYRRIAKRVYKAFLAHSLPDCSNWRTGMLEWHSMVIFKSIYGYDYYLNPKKKNQSSESKTAG